MTPTESAILPFKLVSPLALMHRMESDPSLLLIDVRTKPEYQSGHVAEARLLPLDDCQPEQLLQRFAAGTDSEIVLICQAGKRAEKAAHRLADAGFSRLEVLEGGTEGWIASGQPVVREKTQTLPLMRQVQLAVGVVSLTGAVLALTVNPYFALIPAFTGLGQTFAGATGWCGLALLLGKMPWNRGT